VPVLAHSVWDVLPVTAGLVHFGLVVSFFLAFPHLSWPAFFVLAAIYSFSIAWNVNSVSHNFIHNPYFRSEPLNRLYAMVLSLTMAFSQTMYRHVHLLHHAGNMDRPNEHGKTIDPISIYLHGSNGMPENPWKYALLSFFRDDAVGTYRTLKAKRPIEARWLLYEHIGVAALYVAMLLVDWRFVVCLAPFNYLGASLSQVNGYYEHYGANPELPIAWGVSSYGRLYNWTWFNNGYHAEHHYRPKVHWTRMKDLHLEIAEQQRRAGVRVIRFAHVLGFLDGWTRAHSRDPASGRG